MSSFGRARSASPTRWLSAAGTTCYSSTQVSTATISMRWPRTWKGWAGSWAQGSPRIHIGTICCGTLDSVTSLATVRQLVQPWPGSSCRVSASGPPSSLQTSRWTWWARSRHCHHGQRWSPGRTRPSGSSSIRPRARPCRPAHRRFGSTVAGDMLSDARDPAFDPRGLTSAATTGRRWTSLPRRALGRWRWRWRCPARCCRPRLRDTVSNPRRPGLRRRLGRRRRSRRRSSRA